MNALYLAIILLVTISANCNPSDTEVQTLNVKCEQVDTDSEYVEYDDKDLKLCSVTADDYIVHSRSKLNILNADDYKETSYFRMTESNFSIVPLNLFQLFPKLVKLDMWTNLEMITKESLIGGNNLKSLTLSGNIINKIEANAFDGMVALEYIDLNANELTKVESNAFDGSINLRWLNLGSNKIDAIEDEAFNLPKLEQIILSYNKLETLADNVFVGCPDLKTVYLYGNQLTRIGKSLSNVPKLTTLYLHNREFRTTDFDLHAVARKPNLTFFSVENVSLALDDSASSANDNYTAYRLYIPRNGLSYPDILHRLRNFRQLIALEISNNNFTAIDDIENIKEIFPKLTTLYLSEIPCAEEVVQRLGTKFGNKVTVGYKDSKPSGTLVIFCVYFT